MNIKIKRSATGKTVKRYNIRERILGVFVPRACPLCGELTGNVPIDDGFISRLHGKARTDDSGSEKAHTSNCRTASGDPSRNTAAQNPFICPECYARLDFADGRPRCMRCSRPLDDDTEEFCIDCRRKERLFDRGTAFMMHSEEARKIIYDLKYGNMKDNADFLGYEAAVRLSAAVARMAPEVIIPVPLHPARQRSRGYNQAQLFAERFSLFMELAGYGSITVDTEYLVRAGRTLPLKGMTGPERADNLRGAFRVTGSPGRYRKVLLADDIFTTGATLNECAKTLRQAGVNMIYFITASIGS